MTRYKIHGCKSVSCPKPFKLGHIMLIVISLSDYLIGITNYLPVVGLLFEILNFDDFFLHREFSFIYSISNTF